MLCTDVQMQKDGKWTRRVLSRKIYVTLSGRKKKTHFSECDRWSQLQ